MNLPKKLIINESVIGPGESPFVIAELSANHNGKLERALQIVREAKDAGADAVKLQTFTADTITLDCNRDEFQVKGGLWDGRTLYELYEEAHMPWDWHEAIFNLGKEIGITIFSSPFDKTSVDFLETLGAPAYKVASLEAVDLPLIKYIASKGKPMIISTGLANEREIQDAIDASRFGGCKEIAILHCVSGYPAPAKDYNLRTIPDMIEKFGVVTGLSDHTLGNATAVASVALGGSIIEKHVTLNRKEGGLDDSFSLEPLELSALCKDVRTAWSALGTADYGIKSSEQGNIKFRRSLYFVKNLKAGEVITEDAIRSVRPGFGLAPKHWDQVVGRVAAKAIEKHTPVSFEDLA